MHVSNYNATFSAAHLIFLELEDIHQHLEFKRLDENNSYPEYILPTAIK